MDTNGDLGIISPVGYLRTAPEFVRALCIETLFF